MSRVIGICTTLILLGFSFLGHVFAQKETVEALPRPPHCGAPLNDRLRGGSTTFMDEFPWTALIEYSKSNGQTGFLCGGSLINSRYVLTAAHCVHELPSGWEVTGVRLGEWDLKEERDCEFSDEVCADAPLNMGVEKIIVHENYANIMSRYNDIALIQFNNSVVMSHYVSPVCLPIEEPQRSQNTVDSRGFVAGWAKTKNGTLSNLKQKVQMEQAYSKSCRNTYDRLGVTLEETQMCAKGFNSRDSCSSVFIGGSPFTKQIVSHNYLYGITSIGPRSCKFNDIPEVYTSVTKYIDWIESKIK